MKKEAAGWEYRPDGEASSSDLDDGLSEIPEDNSQIPQRTAKSRTISWTASEYVDHKQGIGWFITLGVLTVVLALGIYFLTKDYFAGIITIMVGVIVGVFAHRTPKELDYELSTDGLQIGPKNYPLRLFKSFSVIQDGALLSLSLMPIKRFMPPVSVYFAPADHEAIMSVLEDSLPYEDRELDRIEHITRRLRF